MNKVRDFSRLTLASVAMAALAMPGMSAMAETPSPTPSVPQGASATSTPTTTPTSDPNNLAAASSACTDGYWCIWNSSGFTGSKFSKNTNVDNFVWFTYPGTQTSIDNTAESVRNRWSTGKYLEMYNSGKYGSALFCVKSGGMQGYLATGQGNRASSARQVASKGGCY